MARFYLVSYSCLRHLPGAGALVKLVSKVKKVDSRVCEAFGLKFSSPVGLSSGLDVNGEYVQGLEDLHFSYLQIGPIVLDEGARTVISNLKDQHLKTKISACLKPYSSTIDVNTRVADLQRSFTYIIDFVDFFTIDLSGTEPDGAAMVKTLDDVSVYMNKLLDLRMCFSEQTPILLKISADCPQDLVDQILDYSRYNGINGIVVGCSNETPEHSFKKGRKMIEYISKASDKSYPVVAACNINTASKAAQAYASGAWLVESSTVSSFRHPFVVRSFCKVL